MQLRVGIGISVGIRACGEYCTHSAKAVRSDVRFADAHVHYGAKVVWASERQDLLKIWKFDCSLYTSGSTSPMPPANLFRMSDLACAAFNSMKSFFVLATFAAPDIVTWMHFCHLLVSTK